MLPTPTPTLINLSRYSWCGMPLGINVTSTCFSSSSGPLCSFFLGLLCPGSTPTRAPTTCKDSQGLTAAYTCSNYSSGHQHSFPWDSLCSECTSTQVQLAHQGSSGTAFHWYILWKESAPNTAPGSLPSCSSKACSWNSLKPAPTLAPASTSLPRWLWYSLFPGLLQPMPILLQCPAGLPKHPKHAVYEGVAPIQVHSFKTEKGYHFT